MRAAVIVLIGLVAGFMAPVSASGPLGIYAIIEKVVFEPNDEAPERVQVWGAFAYVDGANSLTVSAAKKGYLYFRLPPSADFPESYVTTIRNEWADLKAVAGTGQAVGFGRWGYIGGFGALDPDVATRTPPYIFERSPGNPLTDLRVHPASAAPGNPALYATNAGMVKISSSTHAAIVKALQDALK
jgi:hypothetical protein